MSSNAKRALVLYGNDSDISPLSTNLETKTRVNTGAVNNVNLYNQMKAYTHRRLQQADS